MSEYTEEDFKNAEVAVNGHANAARRADPGSELSWLTLGGSWTTDAEMARDGWRPIHERDLGETRKLRADNEALRDELQARQDVIEMQREVVKEHIDSNHDLRNQIKDLQASLHAPAPLGLDTLREAWENAEVTTECHIGDWIIGWLPEHKHFTFHEATCESRSLPPESRVYRRAPEPWQALARFIEHYGWEVDSDDPKALARHLYEMGVRVTVGGEA